MKTPHRAALGVALALSLFVGRGGATTRTDAAYNAIDYLTASSVVTSANIYSAIGCYRPDGADGFKQDGRKNPYGGEGLSKLRATGVYVGSVYSQRTDVPPKSAYTISLDLSILHKGAGNSKWLLSNYPSCVSGSTTGIDCSGFVSNAWEVNRFTVSLVNTRAIPILFQSNTDLLGQLIYADAMVLNTSSQQHIVLLGDSGVDPISWTPDHLGRRFPRCPRRPHHQHRIRMSSVAA